MKHGETSRVRIKGLQIYIWLLSIIHTWKKAVLSNDTKNKDLRTVSCTQQALNKGSYYYHWCRSNETCLVNGGQRNKIHFCYALNIFQNSLKYYLLLFIKLQYWYLCLVINIFLHQNVVKAYTYTAYEET